MNKYNHIEHVVINEKWTIYRPDNELMFATRYDQDKKYELDNIHAAMYFEIQEQRQKVVNLVKEGIL